MVVSSPQAPLVRDYHGVGGYMDIPTPVEKRLQDGWIVAAGYPVSPPTRRALRPEF